MSHPTVISLVGDGMRIDFVPHDNGEDVLQITTRRDGRYESAWGFITSVDFYDSCGMAKTSDPVTPEVQAIIERRLPEANDWPVLDKKAG